ncbi:neutral zinc metallopeptidase [Mycobacterium sp. pUA109]|uniref:neutral zinc metallopeptidase n=1 Tax=Mycobacterium sp. pUA109 TaxID=3238982 RepID=UPI00351B926D
MDQGRDRRGRARAPKTAAIIGACAALVLAGCASVVDGQAVSMLYNPARVGGLPVTEGPSGPRDNAPAPTGTVEHTDNGKIDKLALLSVNDIQDYWQQNYDGLNGTTFTPVEKLISYDSSDPSSPKVCGTRTYKEPNAFYSFKCKLIAWDRGVLLPTGQKYYGDISVTGVLAHEYGHALQDMSKLVDIRKTPTIVAEQQADCFAGVYMRWVAEGQSPRFTLSTTDGLNHLLAGLIQIRDDVLRPGEEEGIKEGHGTALDRVSAFQIGFDTGTPACAAIDLKEIEQRRGDLPMSLRVENTGRVESGEVPIDKDNLSTLMDVMNRIFAPKEPPTLSYDAGKCADAEPSPPASYCPATNTINIDLPALQEMGQSANEANKVMLQGDDTAFSVVMSRYALAVQRERGAGLTSAMAGLRTACLTGVGQRGMADPSGIAEGKGLILSAGDLDEAVSGILANGLVASDVNGNTVPAGFTRILAFRSGLLDGDKDRCFQRFP